MGELLVYDRRIPIKIDAISKRYAAETRRNLIEDPEKIEPFVAINVSFYPAESFTLSDLAMRSVAFYQRKLGTGLRRFGHVENIKRRGLPVMIEESMLGSRIGGVSSDDKMEPLVRKIIGLDSWVVEEEEEDDENNRSDSR
jgi:hypothetical protein